MGNQTIARCTWQLLPIVAIQMDELCLASTVKE